MLTRSLQMVALLKTSAVTVYAGRSRRAVWISAISAFSVYCAVSYYLFEAGPLMTIVSRSEDIVLWLTWAYYSLWEFLGIFAWFFGVAAFCYVGYRIVRVLDSLVQFFEPRIDSSEDGSTSDFGGPRRSVPDTPVGEAPSSLHEELFAPSTTMSVSPDSLAGPMGDGASAFRSQRDRESCLQAASGGVKCAERCMASELFPADGLSLPLCNAQCYLVDTSLVDIIGGELFVVKGEPMPTPAMGG